MKTANLTGAQLDYHVARAEGVPAADLEFRANGTLCVRNMPVVRLSLPVVPVVHVLDYSTNWALTGPLVEKHRLDLIRSLKRDSVYHVVPPYPNPWTTDGDTPLIAICRAVVRAAFGDEVAHVCPQCSGEMRKSAAAGGWAPEGSTSDLDHWYCDGCANVIMFDEVK